jgi:hypothetical protein
VGGHTRRPAPLVLPYDLKMRGCWAGDVRPSPLLVVGAEAEVGEDGEDAAVDGSPPAQAW